MEVENSQETRCLCPGFLLVNGDPIRQSVISNEWVRIPLSHLNFSGS